MRALIFANGMPDDPAAVPGMIRPDDLLIAADGGADLCDTLGITPDVLIGDLDSVRPDVLDRLRAAGAEIMAHPARKDQTDLELALGLACERGASRVIVLAGLGGRWDMSLANISLLAAFDIPISFAEGRQEITLIREKQRAKIHGTPGDILSLIPVGGDAQGVTLEGLEYPLENDVLRFGTTRGVSNVLAGKTATVLLRQGMLLCVHIRQ